MKTLYFDCFAGASGDMTLGALLHLGADFERLQAELRKLKLDEYELSVRETNRAGINCLKFDVTIHDRLQQPNPVEGHAHPHDHEHPHGHHHHDHVHPTHGTPHAHEHAHRNVVEIFRLIDEAGLSPWTTKTAKRVFERLAEAEGKIHGVPPDQVHFHEVGAVDAIIDIVGACVGFELLGVERFVASPMHVGFGFVNCAHGRYPIPAPGTAELLKGVPTYTLDIPGEFVTPTGAAIITTLCSEYTRSPNLVVEKIGYGAGGRDFPSFPNALRLMLGTPAAHRAGDLVTVIETNIDDMTPQVFGHVLDRLLAEGALDVYHTPVQMKKNRPGILLTVLAETDRAEHLIGIILRETTTLGVRYRDMHRRTLERRTVSVETEYGTVTVKIGVLNGVEIKATPEFEDCRRAAAQPGVPVTVVQAAASAAYERLRAKN